MQSKPVSLATIVMADQVLDKWVGVVVDNWVGVLVEDKADPILTTTMPMTTKAKHRLPYWLWSWKFLATWSC